MKGPPDRPVPLLRSLVLHAERLERDDIWSRTSTILAALERRGGRATVFVHPYSAITGGFDLAPRIASLIARGHEIAQHTHFYAWRPGAQAESAKPKNDLSTENIHRVLERDLEYLRGSGADPRGFTAGGWLQPDPLPGALDELGFRYDCSDRTFELRYDDRDPATKGAVHATSVAGRVVGLPTTDSLANSARRLGRSGPGLPIGDTRYELVYVHDYDLVRARYHAVARFLLARWRGSWRTAGELAGLVQRSDRS